MTAKPVIQDRATEDGWVPAGWRFALGRPVLDPSSAEDGDTPNPASQPFGVRFFRPAGPEPTAPPVPFRYCRQRQVAVAIGTDMPLVDTVPSWERTTSGGADGKTPGVEEWHMDYHGDA